MNTSTEHEYWAPIPGWEDLYRVSTWGRVRSLPRRTPAGMRGGRILKGRPLPRTGYLRVHLCKDGTRQEFYIHRLVLLTFRGPCPPGLEACHDDGNPANNRLDNLAWDTTSRNAYDRVRHGTHVNARKMYCPQKHEYTEENTYRSPTTGWRECRTCMETYQERNAEVGKLCITGCGEPQVAKGLCQKHYQREKRRAKRSRAA